MADNLNDYKKLAKKPKKRKIIGLDKKGRPPDFPYVEVRYSSIHNNGLFAAKNIPKGTFFIQYLGEIIPKKESKYRGLSQYESSQSTDEGSVYIFNLDKKRDLDGNFDWNIARLANHSCKPNCEAQDVDGEIWFIALRDIKNGEELTFNYGYELKHWKEHPCLCGESNCIGYIVRKKDRKKLRKILKESESANP